MTIEAGVDIDTLVIDQAESCFINNCKIIGNKTSAPSSGGTSKTAVKITSSSSYTTKHINFKNTVIGNHSLAVNLDHDMNSIQFDGCRFENAYKGVKIGESVTGSTPSVTGPKSVKITGSIFDNIYKEGLHVYDGENTVSAYNQYKEVANNALGTGNASTHVVNFAANVNSFSVGDSFDRGDGDVTTTTKRVNTTNQNIVLGTSLEIGSYSRTYNANVALSNNTGATTTGVSFDEDSGLEYAVAVSYTHLTLPTKA